MARMIFVNLPVKDLAAATRFFTEIGFTVDQRFTNGQGAAMVVEENIYVMLLVEDFFRTFVTGEISDPAKGTEALFALSCDSRQQVDETLAKAIAAGGKPWRPVTEDGPMYGASFADLDGHVWELVHMDPAALEG